MRVAYILLFILLFVSQETLACTCKSIPSFEYTISNIDKDSNILILGELSEFLEYDSDFPSLLMPNTEQYKYVTINVIEDYIGSYNSEKAILLNGPTAACIQSFNYSIGSQLIILAKQSASLRDGKQFYVASFCLESVLYYDREDNMIKGNITPYNSFLIWLYDFIGIYRFPQNQMTLKQVEQIISRNLN